MAKAKATITRDRVLRPTADTAVPPPVQGLPPEEPATRQTAVWLGDAEVEWLDTRCHELKRAGWRSVTRSALIRALIRAAIAQQPDLHGIADEEALTLRLRGSTTPPRAPVRDER